MFGRRDSVNTRPSEARAMEGSSMVGTGFTMEGIHNSYVMYDLMSEMSWRTEPIKDLDRWFQVPGGYFFHLFYEFIPVQAYGARRYGVENVLVAAALKLLSDSVYNVNATARNFHGHVLILRPPSLGLKVGPTPECSILTITTITWTDGTASIRMRQGQDIWKCINLMQHGWRKQ